MQFGVEEVLKLSPDDSSAKAAKGLVVPAKWPRLEFDDQAVWGECQGSGAKPYQVQVDKSGPAFRCSCPSRKFPCKHGLALLLLLAQNPGSFARAAAPAWVSEWLSSRKERAEKQEAKSAAVQEDRESTADPKAAGRREAARLQRMGAGLDDLERWLADRLRQGLAQLPTQPDIWDEMAARMIDAQLPGLAFRLRRARDLVGKGQQWPARILGCLGQMHLLVEAFRRLESLPTAVQVDVRTALGMVLDRDSVLASGERLADDWLVLGQSVDEEERLWLRRVWLQGMRSGRRAMFLDFAHGMRRFEDVHVTGSCRAMTLVFFPGNSPLRAMALDDAKPAAMPAKPAPVGLEAALDAISRAAAANPWQWPQPLLFSDGVLRSDREGWHLQTTQHRSLRLSLRAEDGWRLLAEGGGAPLTLFGQWDGETLRPLSCWTSALAWTESVEAA